MVDNALLPPAFTAQAMVKALAIHPRDETERIAKIAGFIPQ
ncbi:hypothetical protein [Coleofasciculus sp. C1-SOL-03]|jgi:hypothetical protein